MCVCVQECIGMGGVQSQSEETEMHRETVTDIDFKELSQWYKSPGWQLAGGPGES